MKSKIRILGHPVHPMLVVYPVAFYTATFVCYIVYNSKADPFWFKVAIVANIAGVIMAALAALPGFIDWLFIPKQTIARKTGLFHMVCNVLALGCFAFTAFTEYKKWNDASPILGLAIPITLVGLILTITAGFLGWKLVQKHHIGIDDKTPVVKLP